MKQLSGKNCSAIKIPFFDTLNRDCVQGSACGRYPSKFQNLGYRWVLPGTEKFKFMTTPGAIVDRKLEMTYEEICLPCLDW